MGRRSAAGLIIAVWVGALAWLVGRELGAPPHQAFADASRDVTPGATFYTLTLGGQHVGFASSTVDTVTDGLWLEDRLFLEVPALGALHRTEAQTTVSLTRNLTLQSFEASLRSEEARFVARGTVMGDSVLSVDLDGGESHQNVQVPLDEPVVLSTYIPLTLAVAGQLEVGSEYTIRSFDPILLQSRDVEVEVVAESTLILPDSATFDSTAMMWVAARWDTVRVWKVEQRIGGTALESWIDGFGRVAKASSPIGFRMERSAFEIAFDNLRRRDASEALAALEGDVIRQTAIASNVSLSPVTLRELRIRLGGVDLSGFELGGGRQTLVGDTLTIRKERTGLLVADYRLPAIMDEFGRYLEADPLIQSEDPRIQAQARQIVGRTRRPERAARRLNEWVHDQLEKEVTISVPSALEVLESRRGDCNEHTVLYVALARAIGLPARTAAGLVYVNGSFYYHAWPEVYLSEWVAVDPTLGQIPADAAHVRFTIGGLARQVELIRLIGRLNLDVLSAEE